MLDLTKTYRTRNRHEVTNLARNYGDMATTYPIKATVYGITMLYDANGSYYAGDSKDSYLDLVLDEAPAEVPSWGFTCDPAQVVATAEGLSALAVVGIDSTGELVVASSTGTPQTINLFRQALARVL